MTSLTKVLLLSVVVLSAWAPALPAEEITIHGASWGQAESAALPQAAAAPPQRWKQSDKAYKNPRYRYAQGIRYSRRVRYAGGFRFRLTKRDQQPYQSRNGISYAGQFGRNRAFTAPARSHYGSGKQRYGNRINYGHGQGYGLGR